MSDRGYFLATKLAANPVSLWDVNESYEMYEVATVSDSRPPQ